MRPFTTVFIGGLMLTLGVIMFQDFWCRSSSSGALLFLPVWMGFSFAVLVHGIKLYDHQK